MTSLSLPTLLAAGFNQDIARIIFVAVIMVGGALIKKISDARERAERAKNASRTPLQKPPTAPPPSPQSPRREGQVRSEIEAFLEEVGRRRSPTDPYQRADVQRGSTAGPPSKNRSQRPLETPPPPPRPLSASQSPGETLGRQRADLSKGSTSVPAGGPLPSVLGPQRPGEEMASRKAPVSDDLGVQIRSHLAQYLESSRLSQQARADLGKAVEKAVREHLGSTVTANAAGRDRIGPVPSGSSIGDVLRNPANVQTAILVNEILGPPKGLRRRPRPRPGPGN